MVGYDGDGSNLFSETCSLDQDFFDGFFSRQILYHQLLGEFAAYNAALALNPIVSKFRVYSEILSHATRILQLNIQALSEAYFIDEEDDEFDLSFRYQPGESPGDKIKSYNENSILSDTSYEFDGDDITNMSVASSTTVSGVSPTVDLGDNTVAVGNRDDSHLDMVSNVIMIIACMFEGFSIFNKTRAPLKSGSNAVDVLLLLLRLLKQDSNDSCLNTLVQSIRYRLLEALNTVENDTKLLSSTFSIINGSLMAFQHIFEAINSSIVLSKGNPNNATAQHLLLSCCQVDLTSAFEALLERTVSKRLEDGSIAPPKLILSVETLSRLLTTLAVFLCVPTTETLEYDREGSADITHIDGEHKNVYRDWLVESTFDQRYLTKQFKALLGLAFNALYEMEKDLMASSEPKAWLPGWLSKPRSYNGINTSRDVILPMIDHKRYHSSQTLNKSPSDESIPYALPSAISQILPITIILRAMVQDPDFTARFVSSNENESGSNKINLLDQWLCVLSYVFTYQHKSRVFLSVTTIAIELMIEILNTSDLTLTQTLRNDPRVSAYEELRDGPVDEYKWKLCHQKPPLIPLYANKTGYKPRVFYIMDVVQSLLRYNLTNKINVSNYSMAINLIYLIVIKVQKDESLDMGEYQWPGLFDAMYLMLRFVWKQYSTESKYIKSRTDEVLALIEETLLTINEMLTARFLTVCQKSLEKQGSSVPKPIAYSLVYNSLLHYQLLADCLGDLGMASSFNLRNLVDCLTYFDERFHMSEASKLRHSTIPKVNLFEYDNESRELEAHLMAYFESPTPQVSLDRAQGYRYSMTMHYLGSRPARDRNSIALVSCLFLD